MENSNQSAFPLKEALSNDNLGLTKREYAAIMAMQGMLANSIDLNQGTQPHWYGGDANIANIAKNAIGLADELLKQLETK